MQTAFRPRDATMFYQNPLRNDANIRDYDVKCLKHSIDYMNKLFQSLPSEHEKFGVNQYKKGVLDSYEMVMKIINKQIKDYETSKNKN